MPISTMGTFCVMTYSIKLPQKHVGVEPKNSGCLPPQNGYVIMENPIKMDDLAVPLFLETPKSCLDMFFSALSIL